MSAIASHALLSLLPWLAGTLAGGALGCGLGALARILTRKAPGLRDVPALVPWRTFAVFLPLPFPYATLRLFMFGLRPPLEYEDAHVAWFAVSLTVCLTVWSAAMTASTVLSHWNPPALPVRLAGLARWLAVAACAMAVPLGMYGMGGAGFVIAQDINLMRWGEALRIYLWVAVLAMAVDMALGVLQQALALRSARPRLAGAPS